MEQAVRRKRQSVGAEGHTVDKEQVTAWFYNLPQLSRMYLIS